MNRAQRLASAPWCLLGSFWPPLTASHLEIYLSTLRSRLMMETAKVFLINMFFFPLMYSNNKAFSIPMLCINYVFFFLPDKRVQTFILHPDYNINAKAKEGVKEFYDYDVALIQLEEDVQISSAVRWEQLILDLIHLPLQKHHFMRISSVSGLFAFRAPRRQVTLSAWLVTRPASSKVRRQL